MAVRRDVHPRALLRAFRYGLAIVEFGWGGERSSSTDLCGDTVWEVGQQTAAAQGFIRLGWGATMNRLTPKPVLPFAGAMAWTPLALRVN